MTVAAGTEVSFWDLTSWQCLKRFSLGVIAANGYGVNSASLHPNRKAFVAGGGNFWVYQHDFETGEELACNKGHHGPVYGAAASRLSLAPSRLAGESPPPRHAWETPPAPPSGRRPLHPRRQGLRLRRRRRHDPFLELCAARGRRRSRRHRRSRSA